MDATVAGRTIRLLSTHLDGDCLPFAGPGVQLEQARELLASPASTDLPLLLIGDLTSPADGGVTYNELLSRGFSDVWTLAGSGSGLTCCQDSDLLNSIGVRSSNRPGPISRPIQSVGADAVGDEPADKTPSGLWPSDHASVVGVVRVEKAPI